MMGEPGITAAEEYIASEFAAAGLDPLPGLDHYFHDFTVTRTGFDADELVLEVDHNRQSYRGLPGQDFRPLPFSRAVDLAGELVFAGYGISAPSFGHDDYDGLSIDGKIALVLRGEPETDDPDSPFFGEGSTVHAYFKTKAEAAYRRGAVGIVVVNPIGRPERPTDFTLFPSFEVDSVGHRTPPELTVRVGEKFPALLSASALLRWVAAEWAIPADEIVKQMNDGIAPRRLGLEPLPARVGVGQFDPVSGIPVRNVAGVLPGDDPDRFIIVGAHHDHLGSFVGDEATPGEDTIFNGADDNASGVAVVLQVVRRLAEAELEKSVVFVTFSGEEQGLLGSAAFASSRIVDLSAVDLLINVDMAARNAPDPVLVYQGGDLPIRRNSLQSIADSATLPVTLVIDGVGGSDYIPFEQPGVPVIFSFSGFHDDYHGVDDEADRLDYDRLVSVAEFVLGIVLSTAGE